MIVYIATVNGRVLTDPYIHKLLDCLAKTDGSNKIDWVYRCGPKVNDPRELLKELDGLNDSYKVICYESSCKWAEARDEDIKTLRKIKDSYSGEELYKVPNTGQILAAILDEELNKGAQ